MLPADLPVGIHVIILQYTNACQLKREARIRALKIKKINVLTHCNTVCTLLVSPSCHVTNSHEEYPYGVATISRLLKFIGLFLHKSPIKETILCKRVQELFHVQRLGRSHIKKTDHKIRGQGHPLFSSLSRWFCVTRHIHMCDSVSLSRFHALKKRVCHRFNRIDEITLQSLA